MSDYVKGNRDDYDPTFLKSIQLHEDMPELNMDESLCHKCGLCCHDKVLTNGGQMRFLKSRCEWQCSDNTCYVYQNRFTACPSCLTARMALLTGILPRQCGYVEANWELIKDWYKCPVVPIDLLMPKVDIKSGK